MPSALTKKPMMENETHNINSLNSTALSTQQRHDLKSALLSIRWAADLLQPQDGSEPPCSLIATQLQQAYRQLQPFVEAILAEKGSSAE